MQTHLNESQIISQSSLSKSVLHFRCAPAPVLLDSVVGWTEANIPSGNVLIPAQDEAYTPNLLPELKNTTQSNYPNKCIRNRSLEIINAMPIFHLFKYSVSPPGVLLGR